MSIYFVRFYKIGEINLTNDSLILSSLPLLLYSAIVITLEYFISLSNCSSIISYSIIKYKGINLKIKFKASNIHISCTNS